MASKNFANSRASASNSKSFSLSLEHFFLTVGQNSFGNKLPFLKTLFLQLEQKTPQINEKMLKTIRFKSSLCQKLEAELREKEDEIINTKTENFKLEKTVEFLQTNQNQQNQESEKDDCTTTKNLEARLEYLEQMVSESKAEVISSSMAKIEVAKKPHLQM